MDELVEGVGLPQEVDWPTYEHKELVLCLCNENPLVDSPSKVRQIIDAILKIPTAEIEDISFSQLGRFGCPKVWH